jgi:hypothetical protein
MSDKNSVTSNFRYNVDLDEKVPDGKGGEMPRYGRMRDRAFMAMGDKAPFRMDGALYDVRNPGRLVMPTNASVVRDVVVAPGTGRVTVMPERLAYCHAPGVGAFGN